MNKKYTAWGESHQLIEALSLSATNFIHKNGNHLLASHWISTMKWSEMENWILLKKFVFDLQKLACEKRKC